MYQDSGSGQIGSHGREQRDGMAKLCSGHVVQFRYQGRLADLAEMLGGGLRQSEPVMPVTQSILYALESGDELTSFAARLGEFGRVARSFA